MKEAIIFVLDDDAQVLRAVVRDLRNKYRKQYRILSTTSPVEALESLLELRNQGETVALFLSDNRMPEMQGVDFLEKAKNYFPEAKRVLLTAYSDTEAAIKAINDVRLDYYLLKPWDPPEEHLYPVMDELLDEWEANYIPVFKGIQMIGYQFSPSSHSLKDFLSGNLLPYRWLDIQTSEEARQLLELNQLKEENLPVVILDDGKVLIDPKPDELANALGLNVEARAELYDLVIIGAGPAGLGAAVYATSEGLKTLLIDKRGPGGQAGTSSRIENYLGFPNGVSGSELTRRALAQAVKFGTEFLSPQEVEGIEYKNPYKTILLASGVKINAKSVLVTSGVNYRKLTAPGMDEFNGAGVYYGAASTEATYCTQKTILIVGGGNSAGQAAVYLSKYAAQVIILIRKDSLAYTMSSYLIDQIEVIENIALWTEGEIIEAKGNGHLQAVMVAFKDGRKIEQEIAALFVFIGAQAVSHWLPEQILKDPRNFVLTGTDLKIHPDFKKYWKIVRDPYPLETSIPGVFAAGDVRANAMNRVASAVGEGAMSVSMVHKYLGEI